ncbi:Zinc finger CCCH domain-containing protein 19 [Ananas comosus]|uniref:Zinc finger CCCH domain-containing protein 19 n=1 Tax=Ananas comosus TaxID=4615 RepID=A0A199W507_ANACO|nr:Zinc finger CCCH domain-containing protein 19 [Ananas comosus]
MEEEALGEVPDALGAHQSPAADPPLPPREAEGGGGAAAPQCEPTGEGDAAADDPRPVPAPGPDSAGSEEEARECRGGDGAAGEEDEKMHGDANAVVFGDGDGGGGDALSGEGAEMDGRANSAAAEGAGAGAVEEEADTEFGDAVEEATPMDECPDTVAAVAVEEEAVNMGEVPNTAATGDKVGEQDDAMGEEAAEVAENKESPEYPNLVPFVATETGEEEAEKTKEVPDAAADETVEEEAADINEVSDTATGETVEEEAAMNGVVDTMVDETVEEEAANMNEVLDPAVNETVEEEATNMNEISDAAADGDDGGRPDSDFGEGNAQIDTCPDSAAAPTGNYVVEEDAAQMDECPRMDAAAANADEDIEECPDSAVAATDEAEEEAAQMDDGDDEPPPVVVRRGGGRRKRGRQPRAQVARTPGKRKEKDGEEVCFICFDGGDLVVCDRRGCPKVYHPSCVNRDEAFFRAKGRWNCGCAKDAEFLCVRGSKGFCQTCFGTVMLIEQKEQGNETMDGVDFDDKNSWEHLFKDYWLDLKGKLSLTFDELCATKARQKGSIVSVPDEESSDDACGTHGDRRENNSDSSLGHRNEITVSRKRKKKRSMSPAKSPAREDGSMKKGSIRTFSRQKKAKKLRKQTTYNEEPAKEAEESAGTSTSENINWASNELLDFVAHMKDGDRSALSQFDVQALLLEYIKQKNLRDPRRKSQIVCDSLLQNLFGKPRVGHFEMLKLLESHFLTNEASPVDTDENQGGVVDPDPNQVAAEGSSGGSTMVGSDKRRKSRKRSERGPQTNLDEYAAIDVHNINLLYLRRNLVEELADDIDTFDEKVVGSFVRIRISGTGQRQDIYRLVQVVGTGKAAGKYKSGKRMTDVTVEILNLDKKESITIDILSNQDFTEEECKRLRQSIKCGFIGRLTVGEVQEKSRILQPVKVSDWIESEKLRLSHLRDRAKCVEKLQLLSTPEERIRRLNEIPEIHVDPKMDPDYESPEEVEADEKRDSFNRRRDFFLRRGKELPSPISSESRVGARRNSKFNWESNRTTSTEVESPTTLIDKANEYSGDKDFHQTSNLETPKSGVDKNIVEVNLNNKQHGQLSSTLTQTPATGASTPLNINESEKIWHYVDPSGKIQGPFSMIQLRKWNTTGYFPPNLRIWKNSERQEDCILLSDALAGKFEKDLSELEPQRSSSSQSNVVTTKSILEGGLRGVNNQSNESYSATGVNELAKVERVGFTSSAGEASKDANSNNSLRQWQGQTDPRSLVLSPRAPYASQPYQSVQPGYASSDQLASNLRNLVALPQHSSNLNVSVVQGSTIKQPAIGEPQSIGNPQNQSKIDGPGNIYASSLDKDPELPPRDERLAVSGVSNVDSVVGPAFGYLSVPSSVSLQGDSLNRSSTLLAEDSVDNRMGSFFNSHTGSTPAPDNAISEAGQSTVHHLRESSLKENFVDTNPTYPPAEPLSEKSNAQQPESSFSIPQPVMNPCNFVAPNAINIQQQMALQTTTMQSGNTPTEPTLPPNSNFMPTANTQNVGWAMLPQNGNASSAQAQGNNNMNYGAPMQGNPNMVGLVPGQANMNMAWGTPAQGVTNFNNMGLAPPLPPGPPPQTNTMVTTGWVAPPSQGSNQAMNMAWVPQGQGSANPTTFWTPAMQGNPANTWGAFPQGNTNPFPMWIPPTMGNPNHNIGWAAPPQGNNMVPNPSSVSGQGNMNMNWNQPNANPSNWGTQQATDSGARAPWNMAPAQLGHRAGVCKYHEYGHCKKGASCLQNHKSLRSVVLYRIH